MRRLCFQGWVLLIAALCLTACSSSMPADFSDTPIDASAGGAYTPQPESSPTMAVASSTAAALQPDDSVPTSTTTLVETPLSTPSWKLRSECPSLTDLDSMPLWSQGSILFKGEELGIWAIPASNPMPMLAYNQDSWVILSDDGTKLLRFEQNELGSVEGFSVLYDLISQEEIRTRRLANWFVLWDWLPDGRLKYLVERERTFGFGELREFALVNPITGESETVVEELDLPGYQFYEEPFYTGIASVDPTGQLVLYTVQGERGTADVALLNRQAGVFIWQQEGVLGTHGYPHPEPEWAADGSSVLFSMRVSEESLSFYKLFILDRSGQVEKLPLQPFPLLDQDWQLGDLSRSPNEQYIYYNVWQSGGKGPAFIVDTNSIEVGEVCGSGTTFLDGEWLSEGHFLYRVRQDGGYSLRVLDVANWTAQELAKAGPDAVIFSIGWTPVELSQK